jgi:hypothetical protein
MRNPVCTATAACRAILAKCSTCKRPLLAPGSFWCSLSCAPDQLASELQNQPTRATIHHTILTRSRQAQGAVYCLATGWCQHWHTGAVTRCSHQVQSPGASYPHKIHPGNRSIGSRGTTLSNSNPAVVNFQSNRLADTTSTPHQPTSDTPETKQPHQRMT